MSDEQKLDYIALRALAEAAKEHPLDRHEQDRFLGAIDAATVLALLDEREKLRGAIREVVKSWNEYDYIVGLNTEFSKALDGLRAVVSETWNKTIDFSADDGMEGDG